MKATAALALIIACAPLGGAVTASAAYGSGPPQTRLRVSHVRHGCMLPNRVRMDVLLAHPRAHTRYLLQAQLPTGATGEVIFRTSSRRTFRHLERMRINGTVPVTTTEVTFNLYRHTRNHDFPLRKGTATATLPACGR